MDEGSNLESDRVETVCAQEWRTYFPNHYFPTVKMEAETFSETFFYSTPNRQQNVVFGFTLLTFTRMLYRARNTNFKIKTGSCVRVYVSFHIFSFHILLNVNFIFMLPCIVVDFFLNNQPDALISASGWLFKRNLPTVLRKKLGKYT